jgi:hypothetical protein
VIRTQFAAFAPASQEALLNATSHDQTVSFDLMLASRAAAGRAAAGAGTASSQAAQAIRQLAANGAQNLSLMSALGATPIRRPAARLAGIGGSGAALHRRQLGLQRGFGGHQRSVGVR